MSNSQIDFQDVLKLVELIKSSSNFSEIRLRSGDLEVELRRGGSSGAARVPVAPLVVRAEEAPIPIPPSPSPKVAAVAHSTEAPQPKRATLDPGSALIAAPMVGTVYLAPEPGAKPFVAIGQRVSAGEQLCIIEVMKLMTSVNTDVAGTVREILVADGEAVQHGQALIVVSPH